VQCDLPAQLAAVSHAVRKRTGELLHLANGIGEFRGNQVAEIAGEQAVAVKLRWLGIATGCNVLLDLLENPGVRSGGASDHHGVTARLAHHPLGVFGTLDVSVAITGIFTASRTARMMFQSALPAYLCIRVARMNGDRFDATLLCHAADIRGDDTALVPTGANLDRERNSNRGADSLEYLFEVLQIAQQPGAAHFTTFFAGHPD